MTKDGGKAWTEIGTGLPPGKWISRIAASAHEMGTVYLTQNGKRDDDFTPYVWRSQDYGKTWTDISKGIPFGPVNVVREDPVDENIVYVGTDGGVFVTMDRGSPGRRSGAVCRPFTSTTSSSIPGTTSSSSPRTAGACGPWTRIR